MPYRVDPDSNSVSETTTDIYTWTFPGAPISINLPLVLMTRLQAVIADREGSTAEAGGALLGYISGTRSNVVNIRDFIAIPSARQADTIYTLDIGELERLRERMADPSLPGSRTSRSSVIGYFRSQAQGTSELRERELEVVKKYFSDRTNVVLLIQTQQKTAGFFCWWGDFFTPCSFNDFSLDGASIRSDTTLPPTRSSLVGRSPAVVVLAILADAQRPRSEGTTIAQGGPENPLRRPIEIAFQRALLLVVAILRHDLLLINCCLRNENTLASECSSGMVML